MKCDPGSNGVECMCVCVFRPSSLCPRGHYLHLKPSIHPSLYPPYSFVSYLSSRQRILLKWILCVCLYGMFDLCVCVCTFMRVHYVFMLLYVRLGFNSRSVGLLLVLIPSYCVIAVHTASTLTSGEEKVKKKENICLLLLLLQ